MKLKTHYLFSTGLLTLVNTMAIHNVYVSVVLAGLVSVLGNTLIDRLGHEMVWAGSEYIPRRTPLTHTVPRSVLWGVISTVPLIALIYYVYPHYYFVKDSAVLLADGILVGPSHMLLDVFTEKGIYVRKNGKWRRFALAHFRYNDPGVNGLASFAGFILLVLSVLFEYHLISPI